MFHGIGTLEIAIVSGIVLLLFGGRKIPEIAKGLGQGIREFKASLAGEPKPPPPGGS